jgi:hypothetical protein
MMLTYDFIPLIASGIDEIFICFKHDPFRIEGDDGHRTVYGIYDCFLLKSRMHALRNIGSNFNDSDNTAAPVRNGDITGFKPYGTISLCQPQALATKAFPLARRCQNWLYSGELTSEGGQNIRWW